jgi:hypothetical protein
MDPEIRTAILAVGVVFCVFILTLTLAVVAESGLDIISVTSFVIVALIALGLVGAMRSPPR